MTHKSIHYHVWKIYHISVWSRKPRVMAWLLRWVPVQISSVLHHRKAKEWHWLSITVSWSSLEKDKEYCYVQVSSKLCLTFFIIAREKRNFLATILQKAGVQRRLCICSFFVLLLSWHSNNDDVSSLEVSLIKVRVSDWKSQYLKLTNALLIFTYIWHIFQKEWNWY